MNCPICLSKNLSRCFNLYDDRYGYSGYFKLLKCTDCGHKTLQGKFSAELLSELYSNYYPRSALNLESYKVPTEKSGFYAWLNGEMSSPFRWVPKNVCVLDIGCGFGESLGYFKTRGCDAYGVEVDQNIRPIAEKYGYKVHVGLFDPDVYSANFFDYVTMSQVIEHVTDPIATLKGLAKVLKPGAYAILSIPNSNGWGAVLFGRRWINWHVPYHVQHFSLKSMKMVAEKAGLAIEQYKTITSSEWLYYQWIHLVTYPKMGKPSGFWSPKGSLTFKQRIAIRLLSLVHKTKTNHLITRLFDVFNLGDNLVFILSKPL